MAFPGFPARHPYTPRPLPVAGATGGGVTAGEGRAPGMLFNSYVFVLLFLPLVFAGYWALGRGAGRRAALAWLTRASLCG